MILRRVLKIGSIILLSIVSLLDVALLGSLWWIILVKNFSLEFYIVVMIPKLIKNLILLPFEIIIIYFIFYFLGPILQKDNMMYFNNEEKMKLF